MNGHEIFNELKNDIDYKIIPDGREIFADAAERWGLSPDDFTSAHYDCGSIIVDEI